MTSLLGLGVIAAHEDRMGAGDTLRVDHHLVRHRVQRLHDPGVGERTLDLLAPAAGGRTGQGAHRLVANPLSFETGRLNPLTVCNTDSGEQIQREFPDARVVKTLNTMVNQVMIHPGASRAPHASS